jgi:hypothetical protein
MSRSAVALMVGVLTGLLAACTDPSPCDEGYAFRDGYCYPIPIDAAAPADAEVISAGGEVGSGEAGQAGGGEVAGDPSAFGRVCLTDGECSAPASLCAPQLFYCTALGCDVDPTLCPAGWTCMDVSAFAGHAAHMCFKGS